jgi:hypothetical protein
MHKYNYIYKITNHINENYYIGMHSTNNLNDNYMGGGVKIRESIKKYGKESHIKEILEFFNDRDSTAAMEKQILTPEILTDPMCMNLMVGGYGGGDNAIFKEKLKDPEYKKEFSLKCDCKGKAKHMIKVLKERDFDFGASFRGKSHTSETISKMKESKIGQGTGNKNSQFGRKWVRNLKTKECIKIDSSEYENYINLGWEGGRFPSESYSKLTESSVIEIKQMLIKNIKPSEIAKAFDASITAIRKIKRGETWSHIIKIN